VQELGGPLNHIVQQQALLHNSAHPQEQDFQEYALRVSIENEMAQIVQQWSKEC